MMRGLPGTSTARHDPAHRLRRSPLCPSRRKHPFSRVECHRQRDRLGYNRARDFRRREPRPGLASARSGCDASVRAIAPCQAQTVTPGSYGVANLGTALEGLGALTVIATICPDERRRRQPTDPDRVFATGCWVCSRHRRGWKRVRHDRRRHWRAQQNLNGPRLARRRLGAGLDDVGCRDGHPHRWPAARFAR